MRVSTRRTYVFYGSVDPHDSVHDHHRKSISDNSEKYVYGGLFEHDRRTSGLSESVSQPTNSILRLGDVSDDSCSVTLFLLNFKGIREDRPVVMCLHDEYGASGWFVENGCFDKFGR